MKKSLFSTAVLLCTVSFNQGMASNFDSQNVEQQVDHARRVVRITTTIEIPFDACMPNRAKRCNRPKVDLSNATQSLLSKKAIPQALADSLLDISSKASAKEKSVGAAVLQLLIELTKNLKVAMPEASIRENDSKAQSVFGIAPEAIAREAAEAEAAKIEARKAESEAKAAKVAADDAVKKSAIDATVKAREAAAKAAEAASLMTKAIGSVAVLNTAAMGMLKTAGSPLSYVETPPTTAVALSVRDVLTVHFYTLTPEGKTNILKAKYDNIMSSYANAPLTSIVTQAEILIKSLRDQGAFYTDITQYLSSRVKDVQVKLAGIRLGLDPASAEQQTRKDLIVSAIAYNAVAAIMDATPFVVDNYTAYPKA